MVSTVQLKPSPLLQPYVSCYALREFTAETAMIKPHYAQPEYYLTFVFRRGERCDLIDESGKFKLEIHNTLVTLITEYMGYMDFKGDFSFLSVVFKANGLFAIFGIPQKILINTIINTEDILGNDYRLLTEQLGSSTEIHQMAGYLDTYLLKKLLSRKQKFYTATIAAVSNCILNNKGLASIDTLASDSNMGFRNFERRFVEGIGIPPKLYIRITRFYNAIQYKMVHPEKSWTDIAYYHGYYDQSHFIKDSKEFCSRSPEDLFKHTPPPPENFIDLKA